MDFAAIIRPHERVQHEAVVHDEGEREQYAQDDLFRVNTLFQLQTHEEERGNTDAETDELDGAEDNVRLGDAEAGHVVVELGVALPISRVWCICKNSKSWPIS